MREWSQSLVVGAALLSVFAGAPVQAATLLPLETQEARALPHGYAEAVLGMSYFKDTRFPAFTPKGAISHQDLFSLPGIAVHLGLGDWVEIQASFEMLYIDEKLSGGDSDSHYSNGDARLFTKLYLLEERDWIPDAGIRFGVKLPNASVDDRLGTDETDFHIDALVSKDLAGLVSAHVNLGLAILGNPGPTAPTTSPFDSDGQDDLFTWAVGFSSRPFGAEGGTSLRLLAEAIGQDGSRFDNDRAAVRGGLQLAFGSWRFYSGVSAGLVTASENVGVSAGIIYDFEPAAWFERKTD